MFDLIPFAGARWEMTHRDAQSGLVGQSLHLALPQTAPRAVGAASISGDKQVGLLGIQALALLVPPTSDTLDGKLGGVVVNAHIHKALILDQIIHPIRHGFPISQREIIVDVDRGLFSFGLPLAPVVLEIPEQFLLLAIDRDDGIAYRFKLLAVLLDVLKLAITVRMALALNGFLIGSQ